MRVRMMRWATCARKWYWKKESSISSAEEENREGRKPRVSKPMNLGMGTTSSNRDKPLGGRWSSCTRIVSFMRQFQ